jgi:hypothetical protein
MHDIACRQIYFGHTYRWVLVGAGLWCVIVFYHIRYHPTAKKNKITITVNELISPEIFSPNSPK